MPIAKEYITIAADLTRQELHGIHGDPVAWLEVGISRLPRVWSRRYDERFTKRFAETIATVAERTRSDLRGFKAATIAEAFAFMGLLHAASDYAIDDGATSIYNCLRKRLDDFIEEDELGGLSELLFRPDIDGFEYDDDMLKRLAQGHPWQLLRFENWFTEYPSDHARTPPRE